MGYRSDVRIITSKKGFKELRKFTDNYLKENNWEYGNLLDSCNLKFENDNSIYFGWDSIKWYDFSDDCEDVVAISKGLEHLKEQDLSYRYAIMGEDLNDYEESYYESTNEKEQDLEFPCLARYFDDDYVIEKMKQNNMEYET